MEPGSLELSVEAFTKHSKLFEFLDVPGRSRMLDISRKVTFPAGEVVVREGAVGDAFFVITKGSVKVSVEDMGREKQVAVLGAGAFFGEIAVITTQTRSATITALEPLELLRFDREPVRAILKDYPKVHELLARLGVRRTEDTMEKVMAMDDEPLPGGDDDEGADDDASSDDGESETP